MTFHCLSGEGPGQCFRLYTEPTFNELEMTTTPEIKRASLEAVMLQLLGMGFDNPTEFDFIDKPVPPDSALLLVPPPPSSCPLLPLPGARKRPASPS